MLAQPSTAEPDNELGLVPAEISAQQPLQHEPVVEVRLPSSTPKSERLASIDVLRGFTIAMMILVDEIGAAYPGMSHAPWDGVTPADFVMPWFLFLVGVSLALSLRKFQESRQRRWQGARASALRAAKLFALGVLLQGGGWFDDYSFGYNLATVRICGILQRIAFAFLVVALMELWLPLLRSDRTASLAVFQRHALKWVVAGLFVLLHLALTFFTYVPSWESRYGWSAELRGPSLLLEPIRIACGTRGAVASPECSAAGFYDRLVFGQDHLQVFMSVRMPQCSSCSPGGPDARYRPSCRYLAAGAGAAGAAAAFGSAAAPALGGRRQLGPEGAPWCFAHMYDPEGILATLPTVMTVWIGTHVGHVLSCRSRGRDTALLLHMSALGAVLMAAGLAVEVMGMPMNKQLWSPSYMLFTAGSCCIALAVTYALIDAAPLAGGFQHSSGLRQRLRMGSAVARRLLAPLEMMGMNAILVFFLHGTAEAFINAAFYARPTFGGVSPASRSRGSLADERGWIHEEALGFFVQDPALRQLVFVLLKIMCYSVGTWICYRRSYFWKI